MRRRIRSLGYNVDLDSDSDSDSDWTRTHIRTGLDQIRPGRLKLQVIKLLRLYDATTH